MKQTLSRLLRGIGSALTWLFEALVIVVLAPVWLIFLTTEFFHRWAFRHLPRYHQRCLHHRMRECHVGKEVGKSRFVHTGVEMHEGIEFDTGYNERQDWLIVDLSRADEELIGVRTRSYEADCSQPDTPPPFGDEIEYVSIWNLPTTSAQAHDFPGGPRRFLAKAEIRQPAVIAHPGRGLSGR